MNCTKLWYSDFAGARSLPVTTRNMKNYKWIFPTYRNNLFCLVFDKIQLCEMEKNVFVFYNLFNKYLLYVFFCESTFSILIFILNVFIFIFMLNDTCNSVGHYLLYSFAWDVADSLEALAFRESTTMNILLIKALFETASDNKVKDSWCRGCAKLV